jgi:hypothetical protein
MTDVRLTALNPEDSQVYPVACNSSGELQVVEQKIEVIDNDVTINGTLNVNSSNSLTIYDNEAVGFRFASSSISSDSGTVSGSSFSFLSSGNYPSAIYGIESSLGAQGFSTGSSVAGYSVSLTSANNISCSGNLYGYRAYVKSDANNGSGGAYAFYASSNAPSLFGGEVTVTSRSKRWTLVEQGGLCHMVEEANALSDVEEELDSPEKEYPKLRDVFNELNLIESALQEVMTKLKMTPPPGWEVWDGSNDTA